MFPPNTQRSRVKRNVRFQGNIPEEEIDHGQGNGVHDDIRDPLPLLLARDMTGVDHATAAELRITHPTSPNGKVQHSPQPDQSQEDAPAPLHRGREGRDVRSVQHTLTITSHQHSHLAHLIVDQTLRDHQTDGGPEVLSQTLVRGVVEEVVRLADGGKRQQSPDDQTDDHERVLRVSMRRRPNARGDPQTGLQEEGVHLGDLEDDADERRLHEALEGAEDVPVVRLPATRYEPPARSPHGRELLNETLRSARRRLDLGEAHPVVLASGELLVDPHAEAHAQEVASENVRNQLVPPALLEVGQDVLRRDLQVLEPHGEHPQHAPVAEDERLPDPAEEMRENENVTYHALHVLEVVRVLWNVNAAVGGVIAVQQRNAKTRVKELHEFTRLGGGQRQNEQQETLVQNGDGENDLPHDRMGTLDRPLLELPVSNSPDPHLISSEYDNEHTNQNDTQANTI